MNTSRTKYEGPLEKKTNRWKEYHVKLSHGQLFFYKDKSSDQLQGTLNLSVTTFCNSSSSGVLARGYQFSVSTPDIEAHFRASTADQRDKWIREIMSSVTELSECSRQVSMRSVSLRQPEPPVQVYDSTLVVSIQPEHEWYWPGKTRDQAEMLLKQQDCNQFLVRDSGHEPGSYSLSVRVGTNDNRVIFHYIIKRDPLENKFILVPAPDRRFDTLEQVIAYYLDLNKQVGLQPLKNPAYIPPQPLPPAVPFGGSAAAAPAVDVPNIEYTDPASCGMTVNPHEATKREQQSDNRRSVADILDEEFDIMEKGDNRANSYKTAVTQHPTSHAPAGGGGAAATAAPSEQGTENEYVRLHKFPKQNVEQPHPSTHPDDGVPAKPAKPSRPSVSRPGEYMNVTPQPLPQPSCEAVVSCPNNGTSNYLYAELAGGGRSQAPSNIKSGDSIVIRGAERSTPVVKGFGDIGNPLSYANGSTSLFGDGYSNPAPNPTPTTSSCYENCELNNQIGGVTISDPRGAEFVDPRPKSGGMSKSSVKAGKKKAAGKSPAADSSSPKQQYYKAQYPPTASGPVSYNDPCISMTTPPKTSREELEQFPPAAGGPIGYTDPAVAMSTQPPTKSGNKSVRGQQLEEQFPPAAPPGPTGYTDPTVSMSKPPSKTRNTGRHNGNV